MDPTDEFDFENVDIGPDADPHDSVIYAIGKAVEKELNRPKTLIVNPVQLQKMNQMQKAIAKYIEHAKTYPLNDKVTFKLIPYVNQHDIELVLVLDEFLHFKDLMLLAFNLDVDVRIETSNEDRVRVGFTIENLYIEP